MKKFTKNTEQTVNKSKEQKEAQKIKLGKRLKTEIDKKFKTQASFIDECNEISGYNDLLAAPDFISKSFLSDIIHGKKSMPDEKADVFSKVLGVPAAYLLGYEDYPSEKAREDALLAEAMERWTAKDKENIETVKTVMSLLADRHYQFIFELKEVYERTSAVRKYKVHAVITSNNMQHVLCTGDNTRILDDATFFSWLCNNTLTIKIKSEKKPQYFHLNNKVTILSNDNRWIELDVSSFMRMIYDINDSIKSTIQTRCDFWLNYSGFDYKEAFIYECNGLSD